MELLIHILIIIHASLGGLALLSGGIAIATKKGGNWHKKSGIVFFYSMLVSAIVSMIVALMPEHLNLFLFSIGLFSTYFLLSGYRSLRYKDKGVNLGMDRIFSSSVILVGISMVIFPLILLSKLNVVLCVFGAMSCYFGTRDLILYRNPEKLRQDWLRQHVGKMMGGYISAVSAFFVVNSILPGMWNWFTPGIIGSAYITFWMIKLNR